MWGQPSAPPGAQPGQIADKVPNKALVSARLCGFMGVLRAPEVVQREREWVRLESLVPVG